MLVQVFDVPLALPPHRKKRDLRGGRAKTSATCWLLCTSAGCLSCCGWSGEPPLCQLTPTFSTVTPHPPTHTHTRTDMQSQTHRQAHTFDRFLHNRHRFIWLTAHNELSGAVKPAAKAPIRMYTNILKQIFFPPHSCLTKTSSSTQVHRSTACSTQDAPDIREEHFRHV